jgi:ParB family chromosome partitioning protein
MTKRLGRGLAEIIQTPGQGGGGSFVMLGTDQVKPGRFQPRLGINPVQLEELKASIQQSGVIEPIIVRPLAHGTYEVVAGERRLRATQVLGLREIPAIIKTLTDKEALEFSLVENIQRENLNPLEEARGYARLVDEFGYTQEDVAKAVGKDRTTITNLVLALPESIQDGLAAGTITLGHAKALLSVEGREQQLELYRQVTEKAWSVRETEASARALAPEKGRKREPADPHVKAVEDDLRRILATKVSVIARNHGGRIVVEYYSQEDLTRILQVLGATRG